mgnify:CR=1 FL=1
MDFSWVIPLLIIIGKSLLLIVAVLVLRRRLHVERQVRQLGRLHAQRDPAPLRAAATVLLLRDGSEVKLSPKEYAILEQLVIHAGKVLTHRHLLREVWGDSHSGDVTYLRVYIRQLRAKLELESSPAALITTEPGIGYRLRDSRP